MELPKTDRPVLRRLRALIDSGRVPHAMVIDGGSAEERLQAASYVAQGLLCTTEGKKPCGMCAACKKAEQGNHPDIIHITREASRKTIAVEQIRRMRDDAIVVPNEGSHKVYIIDEAELLQEYAQNALLKILEEPPSYAVFILCAPSRTSLLPTVLSRTAVFSLNEEEGESQRGEGNDLVLEAASNLAAGLCAGNELRMLEAVAPFEKKYELLPELIGEMRLMIRDALAVQAGSSVFLSGHSREAQALGKRFAAPRLLDMQRALAGISNAVQRFSNKNLTLTRLCSTLAASAKGITGGNYD